MLLTKSATPEENRRWIQESLDRNSVTRLPPGLIPLGPSPGGEPILTIPDGKTLVGHPGDQCTPPTTLLGPNSRQNIIRAAGNFRIAELNIKLFRCAIYVESDNTYNSWEIEECGFEDGTLAAFLATGAGKLVDAETLDDFDRNGLPDGGGASHFTFNKNTVSRIKVTTRNKHAYGIHVRSNKLRHVTVSENHFTHIESKSQAIAIHLGNNTPFADTEAAPGPFFITDNVIEDVLGTPTIRPPTKCDEEESTISEVNVMAILCQGENATIANNTITNVRPKSENGSVEEGCEGIYLKARRSIVYGNTLVDTSRGMDGAIAIKGLNRATLQKAVNGETKKYSPGGYDCLVTNNQIYWTTAQQKNTVGIYAGNEDVKVWNNRIVGAWFGVRSAWQARCHIYNNIIENCREGIFCSQLSPDMSVIGNIISTQSRAVDLRDTCKCTIEVEPGCPCPDEALRPRSVETISIYNNTVENIEAASIGIEKRTSADFPKGNLTVCDGGNKRKSTGQKVDVQVLKMKCSEERKIYSCDQSE